MSRRISIKEQMSFSRMWIVVPCHLSSEKSNVYLTSAHALGKGQVSTEMRWAGMDPGMSLPSHRRGFVSEAGIRAVLNVTVVVSLGHVSSHTPLCRSEPPCTCYIQFQVFSLWRHKDSVWPSLVFIILGQVEFPSFPNNSHEITGRGTLLNHQSVPRKPFIIFYTKEKKKLTQVSADSRMIHKNEQLKEIREIRSHVKCWAGKTSYPRIFCFSTDINWLFICRSWFKNKK